MNDDLYILWREEYSTILQPTGLSIPRRFSVGKLLELGHYIGRTGKSGLWWQVDFIAECKRRGEQNGFAAAALELSIHTVENLVSIGNKFAASRRRESEHLTLAHYDAVAGLDSQEADALLSKAEDAQLSVMALRQEARQIKEPATIRAAVSRTVTHTQEAPQPTYTPPTVLMLPADLSARMVAQFGEEAEERLVAIVAEWLLEYLSSAMCRDSTSPARRAERLEVYAA